MDKIDKIEKTSTLLIALIFSLAAVIFAFDLFVPLGVAAGVPYAGLVVLSLMSPNPRLIIVTGTVGTILTIAGYFLSPLGGLPWVVITNRLLALFVIWMAVILGRRLKRFEIAKLGSLEKNVKEVGHTFEALLKAAPDSILTVDREGRIQFVNQQGESFFGYSRGELLGQPIEMLIPERYQTVHIGHRANYFSHPKIRAMGSEIDLEARRKDDTMIPVEISLAPMQTGEATLAICVVRDVSERRQAAEKLGRLNAELESRVEQRTSSLQAANKELEAFSYSVAHDLRAPLRQIDGFSNILAEDLGPNLDPSAKDSLEEIRSGVKKMGHLIDDLLNLSRVGRQKLNLQVTGLNSLVEKVAEELKPETRDRQIEWKIGQLPFVECDPNLLEQVFSNLLSNAVKFTRPRDRAVIEVDQMTQDGQPVLFVRDNGVGFNMKHANKLFGIFQRLHRQEDFEGTGVGLATVQRIIHKHGGQVWAEAELDKGAAFFFTLGIHESERAINEEGGKQ